MSTAQLRKKNNSKAEGEITNSSVQPIAFFFFHEKNWCSLEYSVLIIESRGTRRELLGFSFTGGCRGLLADFSSGVGTTLRGVADWRRLELDPRHLPPHHTLSLLFSCTILK